MTILHSEQYPLRRREVVKALLEDRRDLLVVPGLGAPSWDATAAGDHPLTFPMWGAMGGATLIGLGLALAQPSRRVLVITGDGELLMGVGGLATVGVKSPPNLAVAVLDNERYGETGMQPTDTAFGVDLAAMAAAAKFPIARTVRDQVELQTAIPELREAEGPVFVNIKFRAVELPLVLPP